jgi:hypothetical protein
MSPAGRGKASAPAGDADRSTRPSVSEARAAEQALARQRREVQRARIDERFAADPHAGRALVWADGVVTAAVVAVSVLAVVDYGSLGFAAATVDLAVFAVGVVAFCVALWAGAQRSREAEMDIASWFFLVRVAPPSVRRPMLGCLAIQVVVGLGAAIATMGEATDAGDQATKLAFGVLVPIFGLALNGLWSARHGAFEPRRDVAGPGARR